MASRLRTGPSGPYVKGTTIGQTLVWDGDDWALQDPSAFDPRADVPELVAWFNADYTVNTAGTISAWPNLMSMVNLNSVGPTAPIIEAVDGRNWARFLGDGSTSGTGSVMTSSEQALLTPFRYLNSNPTFYIATSIQGTSLSGTVLHSIMSSAQSTASLNFSALQWNIVPSNRLGRWTSQPSSPAPALLQDLSPIDTDVHLVEVYSDADFVSYLKVDGVIVEQDEAKNIANQTAAHTLFALGGTLRNSSWDAPGNFRTRDFFACYPAPSAENMQLLADYVAEDAGIVL